MSLLDLSLPNLDSALFDPPTSAYFAGAGASTHAPRFLLLYGSLRECSYSKLLTLEAAPETHPKVQELRDAAAWAEGMVWTSPERHGAVTGIM